MKVIPFYAEFDLDNQESTKDVRNLGDTVKALEGRPELDSHPSTPATSATLISQASANQDGEAGDGEDTDIDTGAAAEGEQNSDDAEMIGDPSSKFLVS